MRRTTRCSWVFCACVPFLMGGCGQHPLTDYRSLVNAGMSSASVERLKKLDTSDAETQQLAGAKRSGLSDEACVALVAAAHEHHRVFGDAEAAGNMAGAGFDERQILELARADKLDSVSGDAVTLKLIGLSDGTVQTLVRRHLQDQPTLSSAEIARLKNTGLTEAQIVERINAGMTDEQAEREVSARETARNHYGTGFVRIRGRRPR